MSNMKALYEDGFVFERSDNIEGKVGKGWLPACLHVPMGMFCSNHFRHIFTEPHCSVGTITDLRTGGQCFDPRLGQYSFRG